MEKKRNLELRGNGEEEEPRVKLLRFQDRK